MDIPKFKAFFYKYKNKTIDDLIKEVNDYKDETNLSLVTKFNDSMRVKEIYSSNSIEGNPLTLNETKLILENGYIDNCNVKDFFEVFNLNKAYHGFNFSSMINITIDTLLSMQGIITSNILSSTESGKLREDNVYITNSELRPCKHEEVEWRLNDAIEEFNTSSHSLIDILTFKYKVCYIHPFIDGNGRTSRMIMNGLLSASGYCRIIIEPSDRKTYYDSLEKSTFAVGCDSWLKFALTKMIYQYKYIIY